MQKYKKENYQMENIGDWLYLVVIAVAVIGSLFKPKKKQDLNTPPPIAGDHDLEPWETEKKETQKKPVVSKPASTPPQQTPSWQEILKSLTEQEVPVSKPKQKRPKVEAKPFIQSHLSAENTKTKKKPLESSISQRIKKFSNETFQEEAGSSIDLNFSDKDEIKKGIIYSEIFKRKF